MNHGVSGSKLGGALCEGGLCLPGVRRIRVASPVGLAGMRSIALIATMLASASAAATAQSGVQLRGRLVSADGAPVAGASVTLVSVAYTMTSDSAGRFTLSGSPGATLRLAFHAAGFRSDSGTVVLPRRGVAEREFTLLADDAPLPEVNPSDRMLSGRVTDPQRTPIAYANVQLNGGRRFIADDSGRFRIPVNVEGRLALLIRRIGFEVSEVKLPSMPDTAVSILMMPVAIALPETRVTAAPFASLDLHGFYRRMADVDRGINRGYFITPEELEQRKPTLVTSAIDGTPGARVRPIPGTAWSWSTLRIEDSRGCPLTVYLDRIRIQPTRTRGRLVDESINVLVPVNHVSGIEVYPGFFGAPPEYRAEVGTCGVVLLWTK